jgi:hypothetical protein
MTDAQWIQTLHNYGLLESSFRPQADLIACARCFVIAGAWSIIARRMCCTCKRRVADEHPAIPGGE